jgi:hypothetical protein
MTPPQVVDGGTACRYGGQTRLYRVSSRGQPTRGVFLAWALGEVLTIRNLKNLRFYETCQKASDLD